MISSYSGDPFLARRAARAALADAGVDGHVTLGEGMTAQDVARVLTQGGLFGAPAVLLDLGEAFSGQAGVKPRNEVMKTLSELADSLAPGALVIIVDPEATPARQKSLAKLGQHRHLPTPKYQELVRWVGEELERAGATVERGVPAYLADAIGPEPAEIASEALKLALVPGVHSVERVTELLNRPASRDSFDIIEAVADGRAHEAVTLARRVIESGEAVPRIFGAFTWQFLLVAKAVAALSESGGRLSGGAAARLLGVRPFVAERALKLARKVREEDLLPLLAELLEADVRAKSGREQELALESVIISLANRFKR